MNNKLNPFTKFIIFAAILIVVAGFVNERFYKNNSGSNKSASTKEGNATMQSLVGNSAPSFALKDWQEKEYTNENLKGKKVILFINEGLACYPACWDQMKQLSSDARLNTDDTVALSVVMDSKENWQTAKANMPDIGDINVVFDTGGLVSKAFGATVAASSMHGGVPGHSYIIIDKDGIVRFMLDDPKMAINNAKLYTEIEKLK